MRPEDFRRLILPHGICIGLVGSYGDDSLWSHGNLIICTLESYLVVQRLHNLALDSKTPEWDTGAIVLCDENLNTVGVSDEEYSGNSFLLIQRLAEVAWDDKDPSVYVFGIKANEKLGDGPLSLENWRSKTVWLSDAAVMTVEDPNIPSEFSIAWHKHIESKLNLL